MSRAVAALAVRTTVLLLPVLMLGACGRKLARPDAVPAVDARGAPPPGLLVRDGPAPVHERDGGPPIPPDVSAVPEPVPRAEPQARYGNRSPYTVLGRTYTVLPSAQGYVERGIASWYGTKFHGRLTSSREPYDMYAMTAAHKALPLPTFVRVTNLDNGRSVVVRVNDRGPFHADRIIDLSYAAAVKLGIHVAGTGKVEVRAIDPQHPELAVAPAVPAGARETPLFVQAGAFASRDNALRLAARIEDNDIDEVVLDRVLRNGRALYRVRVGPLRTVAEADAVGARLRAIGLRGITVAVE
ncbi:MAG: septal ring lytic transglycosylase RlpA family protein [Pseudomonadota bacterium]